MLPIGCGVLCLSLYCCAILCVFSNFAIIFKRKTELVALLLVSYGCLVTVNVLTLPRGAVDWSGVCDCDTHLNLCDTSAIISLLTS